MQRNDNGHKIEQNHMKRAMTDQINLSADTDKARSFNRDCKTNGKMNKTNRAKALLAKIAKKGKSTNRWRNINSSIASGGEVLSGSEIKRKDISRCDQVLRDR